MEFKQLTTRYIYRIEPKPEGGFVARCGDPSMPEIDAPTREELQKKIQGKVTSELAREFPGLPLNLQNGHVKFKLSLKPTSGDVSVASNGDMQMTVTPSDVFQFAKDLKSLIAKDLPGTALTPTSTLESGASSQMHDAPLANIPIKPESSAYAGFIRVLILLVAGAVAYFFFLYHR